jgi:hypothetical protein
MASNDPVCRMAKASGTVTTTGRRPALTMSSKGGDMTLATGTGDILERLLIARSDQRDALRSYVQRAKALRNECGCAMGGAFLIGSIGLLILYHLFLRDIGRMSLLTEALVGAVFVFGAGMIGKAVGVGIARVRLAVLYRGLRVRYRTEGV